jgi:thymidylate kinase
MFGMRSQRGAFIVFEGCDRAGKSTQCKKLVQALREKNIEAEYMSCPGIIVFWLGRNSLKIRVIVVAIE